MLYAYTYGLPPREEGDPLREARDFAAAQGWTVLDEITDDCPPSTARRLRPGWRRLVGLVSGQDQLVEGIVCPREECLTDDPSDRSVIRAWAQVHGVFIRLVHRPTNHTPTISSAGDKGVS
ncbi:hypothetical protein [Streptomyces sp. NPDC059003]|uniref:hypothetical protein n=1 Tax=Streptomyces sp. NPDC059003 TaxID=3346691 RepID=UPI0036B0E0ED